MKKAQGAHAVADLQNRPVLAGSKQFSFQNQTLQGLHGGTHLFDFEPRLLHPVDPAGDSRFFDRHRQDGKFSFGFILFERAKINQDIVTLRHPFLLHLPKNRLGNLRVGKLRQFEAVIGDALSLYVHGRPRRFSARFQRHVLEDLLLDFRRDGDLDKIRPFVEHDHFHVFFSTQTHQLVLALSQIQADEGGRYNILHPHALVSALMSQRITHRAHFS